MQSETFLIGLVVTVAVVGVAGSIGLTVLVCFKWKQYVKLRNENRVHPNNRTHRRRRIRVRNAEGHADNNPAIFEPPPPYSEVDTNPVPPYTPMGMLAPSRLTSTRGTTHGPMTPLTNTRTPGLTRNTNFSQLGTGTTNTPMVTPSVSMFSASVGGTREPSASSNIRSIAMVHIGQPEDIELNNRNNQLGPPSRLR